MCADFVSNSVADTPHLFVQGRISKAERGKKHIQTRICGVHVICGPIDELFVYFTDNMMPGGTNTMIQIMRMAIYDSIYRSSSKLSVSNCLAVPLFSWTIALLRTKIERFFHSCQHSLTCTIWTSFSSTI
jgi:hypothetical protein